MKSRRVIIAVALPLAAMAAVWLLLPRGPRIHGVLASRDLSAIRAEVRRKNWESVSLSSRVPGDTLNGRFKRWHTQLSFALSRQLTDLFILPDGTVVAHVRNGVPKPDSGLAYTLRRFGDHWMCVGIQWKESLGEPEPPPPTEPR